MVKTKRILSLLMIVIMLSGLLTVSVFAEQEPVYEKGKTYSVNGVDYFVEENGCVTVKGASLDGTPERVEILPKLGEFTVTSIGVGAFYKCEAVKEVIIPETVTVIAHLAFEHSSLTDIEIKGKNVNISTRFRETPLYKFAAGNWINREDNLINDVLVVSGYVVDAYVGGELVLGEDVAGISEKCFKYGSGALTKLTVLNPDCHIFDAEELFPSHTVLCGYRGSTVQEYAQRYGCRFSLICNCDDTVLVPATNSYCNGAVGYGEGYWCNNCNMYASGGVVDTSFEHMDDDGDNVCDLCSKGTDTEILNAGKCGDQTVWILSSDGVLRISGTGDVYTYDYTNREPWYNRRNEIKTFIAEEGIERLHGISFKEYQNLEAVKMADTVLSLPKSFQNCTALKNINFPKMIRVIPDSCFEGCTSLEGVSIPKNVAEIKSDAFYKCTNLGEIDFETGYVRIGSYAFYGTAAYNNPDNIKDGCLYIDNCLIKEITAGATSLVLGKEITSIASGWKLSFDSQVTELAVYNPDCVFPSDSSVVSSSDTLKGYAGSTAQSYRQTFGGNFEYLAPHTHVEVIDIPAVMPTQTEPGYTHLSHCGVCGETMSERQLISHEEYDISVGDGTATAKKTDEATVEADGADTVITFAVQYDICTTSINQTVIHKVGEVKLSETEFIYNGKVQKPNVTVKDSKGNTLVKDRDYTVTYSANSKYCGEYSVQIDYIGNYAGGKTLYYEIVIEAISPVVSSSTAESITLSWEKGHSDLVYRVYSVDGSGNLTKIDDTKNGSYEVSSLEAGTEYRFLVRAYVKDDNGKVYWGDEGDPLVCATESDKVSNSIINFLSRYFFAIFSYILKTIFMMK